MVPAILILTLAWTLKSMTDSLGAAEYVSSVVALSLIHIFLERLMLFLVKPVVLYITHHLFHL